MTVKAYIVSGYLEASSKSRSYIIKKVAVRGRDPHNLFEAIEFPLEFRELSINQGCKGVENRFRALLRVVRGQ